MISVAVIGFYILRQVLGVPGVLVYDSGEYSFRFERSELGVTEQGVTSLSIGTLQVEVDVATGQVLFVWGLHPHTRWREGRARPERVVDGGVAVRVDQELVSGISVTLVEVGEWVTTCDSASGWVHVHPLGWSDDGLQVRIADGTVLGLKEGELSSVWLKPSVRL